jgi:hypothetical protein
LKVGKVSALNRHEQHAVTGTKTWNGLDGSLSPSVRTASLAGRNQREQGDFVGVHVEEREKGATLENNGQYPARIKAVKLCSLNNEQ